MNTLLLISNLVSWALVLTLGFVMLGTLRALGVLTWRVDQLGMVQPSRIGRDGLKVGKPAPDFTLPGAANGEASLHDFAGRTVLLVFMQSGCGPCRAIIPELNRVHDKGQHQVLVVNNGAPDETCQWASDLEARFPVLAQEKLSLSKRYEVYATPFAFLIDEQGVIASKGIVGSRQYLNYVLTGAGQQQKHDDTDSVHEQSQRRETERDGPDTVRSESLLTSREVTHV
jgi:methylamine dehydrogenase accessory protein MauD